MADADENLANAIHVSFLEHIDFDGPRGQEAWRHLSTRQREVWKALAKGWGHSFPKWMD
jgi:hypothetical protein